MITRLTAKASGTWHGREWSIEIDYGLLLIVAVSFFLGRRLR